ncbi:MAG: type II toxin-antitoxin system PemK/MazF family toxin [Nitrospirota bacterium]
MSFNLGPPSGSEPGFRHPHVVIQNNIFNQSRINLLIEPSIQSSRIIFKFFR